MKKYLFSQIFLIIILLLSCPIKAQTYCMTPSSTDNSNVRRLLQIHDRSERSYNINYLIKVYFHVIRTSYGNGGQSLSNVNQAFQILNNDYNPHHIYFVWNDSIDYIDNNNYYYTPSSSIFNYNNHTDGIDIYLYPDDISGNGNGLANGVGVSSEFYVAGKYWVSPYPSLITSHVVSHEMGHVLFLWHTHHGTYNEGGNDNPCAELVNGSNSEVCGDYVVDTPADPHLHFNVNPSTYQWLGSGQDANGDNYQPDTRQIMSYTDIRCMTYFSSGQGERMRNAIEALPYLQAASVSIHGPTVPTSTSVYYLENLPSNYSVTWSWKNSSTIPIVSNTPYTNSCTINNTNKAYINNILVATIQKTGNPVTTIEKEINTGANFNGTYEQDEIQYGTWYYPGTTATSFHSGDTIRLYKKATITLSSNNFIGATITWTGNTPLDWTNSNGAICFHFKYLAPNDPGLPINSLTPPSLDNTAELIITGTYPNSYETFQFMVRGSDLGLLFPMSFNPELNVEMAGDQLDISLFDVEGIGGNQLTQDEPTQSRLPSWSLSITNVETGKQMYNATDVSSSICVYTNNWEQGIYLIQARIGGTTLTKKIMISTKRH